MVNAPTLEIRSEVKRKPLDNTTCVFLKCMDKSKWKVTLKKMNRSRRRGFYAPTGGLEALSIYTCKISTYLLVPCFVYNSNFKNIFFEIAPRFHTQRIILCNFI